MSEETEEEEEEGRSNEVDLITGAVTVICRVSRFSGAGREDWGAIWFLSSVLGSGSGSEEEEEEEGELRISSTVRRGKVASPTRGLTSSSESSEIKASRLSSTAMKQTETKIN